MFYVRFFHFQQHFLYFLLIFLIFYILGSFDKLTKSELIRDELFKKRAETGHIDCGRILRNDKEYMAKIGHIPIVETLEMNMSCSAIRERIIGAPTKKKIGLKNGVAFARNVMKDYEFLEEQIRNSYHFKNVFCFAVDRKADAMFQKRMKKLGKCFPNVFVLDEMFKLDSQGHNTNLAHHKCMDLLVKIPGWNYLIFLQNNDIIGKSIQELEQIFEALGGANDVEITVQTPGRIKPKWRWDPKSLNLFKNPSEFDPKILDKNLTIAKGCVQSSISREAAEFIINKLNMTTFFEQMRPIGIGGDEQFISTLHANPALGLPGHFTDECINDNIITDFITRMSQWQYYNASYCASKFRRHYVCILGIEDLPFIAQSPNILFNKVIPTFDYGIIDCTSELLYNRTYLGQNDHELEVSYFENMVNVIYHKRRHETDYKLNCTPSYVRWGKRKYPL